MGLDLLGCCLCWLELVVLGEERERLDFGGKEAE